MLQLLQNYYWTTSIKRNEYSVPAEFLHWLLCINPFSDVIWWYHWKESEFVIWWPTCISIFEKKDAIDSSIARLGWAGVLPCLTYTAPWLLCPPKCVFLLIISLFINIYFYLSTNRWFVDDLLHMQEQKLGFLSHYSNCSYWFFKGDGKDYVHG